jgi:hypothetical protein
MVAQYGELGTTHQRIKVEFDLSPNILGRLDDWRNRYGLEREEALRFIVGQFLPDYDNLPPIPSSPIQFGRALINPEDKPDPYLRMMANLFSSQGAVKCPECLQKLSADAIIEGKCQNCGKEL